MTREQARQVHARHLETLADPRTRAVTLANGAGDIIEVRPSDDRSYWIVSAFRVRLFRAFDPVIVRADLHVLQSICESLLFSEID